MQIRSSARPVLGTLATVTAPMVLVTSGSFVAFITSVLWGASLLVLMEWGMRSAPEESWQRPSGRLGSSVCYGMLVLLIVAPAIAFVLMHGWFAGVASAWLILVTGAGTHRLLKVVFGPIQNPCADEPRIAHEQPAARFGR